MWSLRALGDRWSGIGEALGPRKPGLRIVGPPGGYRQPRKPRSVDPTPRPGLALPGADGAAAPGRRNGGPAPRRPSPRLAGGSPLSLTSHHRRHGRPGSAWFPRDCGTGQLAVRDPPDTRRRARRGGRRGFCSSKPPAVESPGVRPTGEAAMTSYSEFAEPRAGGRRPAGATDAVAYPAGDVELARCGPLDPGATPMSATCSLS